MAQWLKEQSAQMVQSVLGGVPTAPSTQAPSVVGHGQHTDQQSISLSSSDDHVMVDNHQAYQPEPADFEELPGSLELELELEQNKRGSYYYTYTGSVISQSLDDRNSGGLSRQPTASSSRSIPYQQRRAARASRMTEDVMEEEDGEIGTLEQESVIHGDEFLQYLPPSRSQDTLVGPNSAELTECSSCGVMLDTFRYVCATCGPRAPRGLADATASLPLDVDPTSKGKGRADTGPLSASPRPSFPTPPGSSSTGSSAVGELPPFPMSPPYSPPQPLYDRAHSHGHLHSRSTQLSPHPPPPHNPYTPDRSPVSTPAHPPSSPSGGSIWSMIESGNVPLVRPHLNTSSPSISKPLPQIPGSLPTTHTYPPPPPPSHSPASSWSARNVFNRESPFADPPQLQPPPPPPPPQQLQLPQVQQLQQQPSPVISPRSPRQGSGSQTSDSSPSIQEGFELCTDCMETAGIEHASGSVSANPFASPINGSTPGIAANAGPGSYQESVSSSPRNRGVYTGGTPGRAGSTSSLDSEDARSWKRSVPWKKGQLRHAFKEKVWTPSGWTDVEHDDISKCTTCGSDLTTERFKCATCLDMVVCRGCYSQIHEIHPIHAFLTVPERKDSSSSTPESEEPGERSLLHDGLKCSHCLMEIVGARFHCAICPSVDICSNCESAGLPGNLTSPDGGHDSSHIMIKVPFPLTSSEVDMASRKALLLWRGRDGPNVAFNRLNGANDANINGALEHDPYADTVIGGGGAPNSDGSQSGMQRMDHGMYCNGCGLRIIGVRYQCAGCPSSDGQGYSLCVSCEARSYQLHDAMHCFFKIPRPLDRKIQEEDALLPPLYILAAGESLDEMPPGTSANDPRAYLQTIVHRVALCDRCIQRITGEWYHCAYCAKDLCDACEAMDSHDASHLFVVFKSVVDMSILRTLTDVENPQASRPLIGYPVYTQSL
ncbi:hypothetical protein FRB91_010651 [Serendipita sp. 411]|nr:hypothetical protein FRB91_010651 [Serendipita sp. 411]